MQLANAWLSTHRYADGYAWFAPLANERPLFEALAGVFQASSAGEVPLLERVAWVVISSGLTGICGACRTGFR